MSAAMNMSPKNPLFLGVLAVGVLLYANKAKASALPGNTRRQPGSIIRGGNGQLYRVGSDGRTLQPISSGQASQLAQGAQPGLSVNLGSLLSGLFGSKPNAPSTASGGGIGGGRPAAQAKPQAGGSTSGGSGGKSSSGGKPPQKPQQSAGQPRSFSDDPKGPTGSGDVAGFSAVEAAAMEQSRQEAFNNLASTYESDSTLAPTDPAAFAYLDQVSPMPQANVPTTDSPYDSSGFTDYASSYTSDSTSGTDGASSDGGYDSSGFNEFALGYGDAQAPDFTDYGTPSGDGGF